MYEGGEGYQACDEYQGSPEYRISVLNFLETAAFCLPIQTARVSLLQTIIILIPRPFKCMDWIVIKGWALSGNLRCSLQPKSSKILDGFGQSASTIIWKLEGLLADLSGADFFFPFLEDAAVAAARAAGSG